MSYRIKYILLVSINIFLFGSFIFISHVFGWDTERRFVDLDISKTSDFHLLSSLIIIFFICFLANFLIIASSDKSLKTSDMETLTRLIRRIHSR